VDSREPSASSRQKRSITGRYGKLPGSKGDVARGVHLPPVGDELGRRRGADRGQGRAVLLGADVEVGAAQGRLAQPGGGLEGPRQGDGGAGLELADLVREEQDLAAEAIQVVRRQGPDEGVGLGLRQEAALEGGQARECGERLLSPYRGPAGAGSRCMRCSNSPW
jgi:hypothetical protein